MGVLSGKKGLILGVANNKSIAWGVARAAHEAGAELGFSFVGEALEKRVRPLAESLGSTFIESLDVSKDADIDAFFAKIADQWKNIDFVVHSIAYANKDALKGRFVNTTREDFLFAQDISAYSFVAVAQRALPLLNENASLLTMSYLGAVKAVPNYAIMGAAKASLEASTRYLAMDLGRDGIRVNAISAGPIRTLASSAVGDFKNLMGKSARGAMLKRNVSQEEVGRSAVYLLSDWASGVSGEVHYVDAGFNVGAGDPGEEF